MKKNLIDVRWCGFAVFILFFCVNSAANAGVIEKLHGRDVALTFDACETATPSYFDEKILSYLIKEKIPFTVFVSGRFATRNEKRLREIAKLPFVEVENHSMNHCQHMEFLSDEKVRQEILRLDWLVQSITGKRTKYFRFPGGNYNDRVLKQVEQLNFKIVHWTFSSGDADKNITPKRLIQWVVSRTRPGDILVFHINGRGYSTGDALPDIVSALRQKGFRFVKLEDGGL